MSTAERRHRDGGGEAGEREPTAPDDLLARIRKIHRENELLFEHLAAGERRVHRLARAVWKVQEEERRRLAAELHDGVGQTLTALKMRLEWLSAKIVGDGATDGAGLAGGEETWQQELVESAHIAGEALDELRRLAHLLRPQVLDDLGLAAALRWLARTLGEWTGFRVELELVLDGGRAEPGDAPGDIRWDPDVETLLFRATQEALTNAMKHSGAEGATVCLQEEEDRLVLRVEDRGRGFEVNTVLGDRERASGFGLDGLRDRIEMAGGRFGVASRPGRGTVVTVEVPLSGGGG